MAVPPTDSLEAVANTARTRINDAIASIGGDIFTDTQPFTIVMINAAWRRIQLFLSNLGFAALKNLTTLTIPATLNFDVASLVAMSWTGFYNSSTIISAPVLPQDFISPLTLRERVTGTIGTFTPIDLCLNGLPTLTKGPLNKLYEWRSNGFFPQQQTLNFPGTTGATDLLMLYAAFFPDFVPNATTAFSAQQVSIVHILSPLAWLIAAEVAKPRADLDAGSFEQAGFAEAQMIFNRDLAQGRSLYKPSETGKMAGAGTPSMAPNPRNP